MSKNGEIALETVFGWVLCGKFNKLKITSNNQTLSLCNNSECDVNMLWQMQEAGISDKEISCTTKVNEDITVLPDGRYETGLLWKDDHPVLNSHIEESSKRLKTLSNRLKNNRKLLESYHGVIDEYKSLGIIEKVTSDRTESQVRYIPHHPVIREDKITTKVRIVFDASAKDSKGVSLNSCLDKGRNLLPDLTAMLLRFRLRKIVLNADIEKAFLQISLYKKDRDSVRFLWYDEEPSDNWPTTEPVTFRFTRVVFGLICSPHLLNSVIHHHIDKEGKKTIKPLQIQKEDIYVDDFIKSCDTTEEAIEIYKEANRIFSSAKMNLRKWNSNEDELCKYFETVCNDNKILGVRWDAAKDVLVVQTPDNIANVLSKSLTKRSFLKYLASIFDPLGILSPVTVTAKILLQNIWLSGTGWDNDLDNNCMKSCLEWFNSISECPVIHVPRWLLYSQNCNASLHVFSDASSRAYASVAYLCIKLPNSKVQSRFIMCKTKVKPTSEISVPRLELMACVLSTRLANFITTSLSINCETYFYTDSMVALGWIRSDSSRWKQFVANRVSQIHAVTSPKQWLYIKGSINPADLPSRGCTMKELNDHKIWWEGPFQEKSFSDCKESIESPVEEAKTYTTSVIQSTEAIFSVSDHNSFQKVLNITTYVLTFLHKCRKTYFTELEVRNEAEKYWIKLLQTENYAAEINDLHRDNRVQHNSNINSLNPFLDEEGIIRVGSRLRQSDVEYDVKHPILIPPSSTFSKLLIRDTHFRLLHAGCSQIVAEIRQRYWIPKLRCTVKKIIHECIICRRYSTKSYSEIFAPLPKERISWTNLHAFLNIGIDFFGPLYIKEKRTLRKCYVLLITCCQTRAIHLEVSHSLSAQDCMMCLERFISRRGLPSTIFSDNAKCFVSVNEKLKERFQITWKFITPGAPWHGGFYERLIRCVKSTMKKVLKRSYITFYELETLMCKIENVLNDRPLTFIDDDLPTLEPLCPNHFLIGRRSSLITTNSQEYSTHETLNRRLKHQKMLLTHFKKRWKLEYLPLLIDRNKNPKATRAAAVGDIVLIEDNNKDRNYWTMARIEKLCYSSDNRVRSVYVKVGNQLYKKPIQKLYPLELSF